MRIHLPGIQLADQLPLCGPSIDRPWNTNNKSHRRDPVYGMGKIPRRHNERGNQYPGRRTDAAREHTLARSDGRLYAAAADEYSDHDHNRYDRDSSDLNCVHDVRSPAPFFEQFVRSKDHVRRWRCDQEQP